MKKKKKTYKIVEIILFNLWTLASYLHYYVGSDRTVCIVCSLIPRHIIPSSRVYLSQTHSGSR